MRSPSPARQWRRGQHVPHGTTFAGDRRTKQRLTWAVGPLVGLATFASVETAHAERILSALSHVVTFDADDYQDLLWTTQGATHTWVPNGWKGGAAKFTPCLTDEGYSGLGQFILGLSSIPPQLNVRFFIYHGRTWRELGPGNKLVIMNRSGNPGRPMIITHRRRVQRRASSRGWRRRSPARARRARGVQPATATRHMSAVSAGGRLSQSIESRMTSSGEPDHAMSNLARWSAAAISSPICLASAAASACESSVTPP